MRDPNHDDVNLVLKLYDLRREVEMRRARTFILSFEPKSIDELFDVLRREHPENRHFNQVTSYWEMVADFALRGLYHPEMYATHSGEAFVIYARLEPFVAEMHRRGFVRFQANIAECAKRFPACRARLDGMRQMMAARAAMPAPAPAPAPKKAPSKRK